MNLLIEKIFVSLKKKVEMFNLENLLIYTLYITHLTSNYFKEGLIR